MSGLMSAVKGFREYLTPVRTESAFEAKGVLTPEEFVAAGDQLVFKCPTWAWEAGNATNAKPFLPKDKQYLVTRHVPCHRRVTSLEGDYVGDTEVATELEGVEGDSEEAWVEPNVIHKATGPGASQDELMELQAEDGHMGIGGPPPSSSGGGKSTSGMVTVVAMDLEAMALRDDHFHGVLHGTGAAVGGTEAGGGAKGGGEGEGDVHDGGEGEGGGGGGERGGATGGGGVAAAAGGGGAEADKVEVVEAEVLLPDLDTYVEDNVDEPDEATLNAAPYLTAEEPEDHIVKTRTYDLSITYDKYYQTPRMWLFGYDEGQQVLSGDEMFEDVMQDYHNQTVTIECHPHHPSMPWASVHPCKHAAVMRRMVANMGEARVDQYLFIFLKFIQSVVPTIDYDYTMAVAFVS